jgi:hypothetical protein
MTTRDAGEGCPQAEALAALARELEGLRERLADVLELPGVVSELGGMVTTLAEDLSHVVIRRQAMHMLSWLNLAATLPSTGNTEHDDANGSDVEGSDPAEGESGRAMDEAAAELLAELSGWVGRVYLRYPDARHAFPECWLWHPEVVEELLWLMTAWKHAYQPGTSSVLAAGDWHDRYRPGVVKRIGASAGSCSLEAHLGTEPAAGSAPAPPVATAAWRIAAWWTSADLEHPPEDTSAPVPTRADLDSAAQFWRQPS